MKPQSGFGKKALTLRATVRLTFSKGLEIKGGKCRKLKLHGLGIKIIPANSVKAFGRYHETGRRNVKRSTKN